MGDINTMTCEELEAAMNTATDPDRVSELRYVYERKGCGAQTNDGGLGGDDGDSGDSGPHGPPPPPPPGG